MTDIENVYFDAGGYYSSVEGLGSIKEMLNQSIRPKKIYGCSSGALIALTYWLILNGYVSLETAERATYGMLEKQAFLSLDITQNVVDAIDGMVSQWPKNLASLITDKVYIGVSSNSKNGGFKWISHYETNADVYHALLATTSAPGASSYSPRTPSEFCLDGFICFKREYLPDNTLVLRRTVTTWVSISTPPKFIWPALEELGRRSVNERARKDKLMVATNAFRRFALFLQEHKKYDDRWNQHIDQIFEERSGRRNRKTRD